MNNGSKKFVQSVWKGRVLKKEKNSDIGFGFDASNNSYVDMKKVGIVDPTKVTRSALQNAESIASMVLTTESIVTDKKEDLLKLKEIL